MGKRITDLPELTTPTSGDWFEIVDASDISESAEGTSKRVDYDNISIADASTTVKGKVELLTDAETITGTDPNRVMTASNLTAKIDTDGTLAGNLDTRIPSQKAVKTYVDTEIAASVPTTGDWNSYSAVVPTLASATDDKYTLTFAGVDLTSVINVGKRVKLTQTVGSNTQSLDLESGSSQYATKTDTASLSITGTITIEAWINLESFSSTGAICSKFYQDGNLKAYMFTVDTGGTISLTYSGDSFNESACTSSVCITTADIGRWIHVAVTLTPSTKAFSFYKNGVLVNSGTATGTQTAIADNTATFAVGARDVQGTPDTFFDGKICELRLWSTSRTQAQIRDNMFHNLAGNESGLNAYWKFDNAYTDLTANANTLTSSGSPSFAASVPLKLTNGTKFGIVSSISFSTNTTMELMMGSEYGVDGGTISAFNYSLIENPIGFPVWMNYFSNGPTGTSITSRFTTHGRTVECIIRGVATGAMTWTNLPTIPLTCSASAISVASDASGDGVGGYLDSGTINSPAGLTPSVSPSGTTVRVVGTSGAAIASATVPITWAANDTWYLHFSYEF